MDKVFIKQLRVDTIIGVYDFEKQKKQPLFFDVEMHTDIRPAALHDELSKAIDYAAVSAVITQFCQDTQFELLETLLARLGRGWRNAGTDVSFGLSTGWQRFSGFFTP